MSSFRSILFLILSTTISTRLSSAEEISPSYIDESLSFILGKLSDIEQKFDRVDQRLIEISTTVTVTMQHLLVQSPQQEEARRSLDEINQRIEDLHTSQHETRAEIKTLTKTSEESLSIQRKTSKLDWKNLDNTMTSLESLLGLFQNKTSKETVEFESGFIAIPTEIRKLSNSQGELSFKLEDHISRESQLERDRVKLLEIIKSETTCREVNATIESAHKDLTMKIMDNFQNFNKTLLEHLEKYGYLINELIEHKVTEKYNSEMGLGSYNTELPIKDHNTQSTENGLTDDLQSLRMTLNHTFENCSTAFKTIYHEGVFKLQIPQTSLEPFYAYCLINGWMVIQRRHNGSTNFERDWNAYKYGFGDPHGDHWLGLEKIHAITSQRSYSLVIVFYDSYGNAHHSLYSDFKIGSEKENYKVTRIWKQREVFLGQLKREQEFLTYDRASNCKHFFSGAWWYENCKLGDDKSMYVNTINGKVFDWSKTEMMINSLN